MPFGWIKENLLGGAAKTAAREQQDALREAQDMTREFTERARKDVLGYGQQAFDTTGAGYQSALELLGGLAPQQAQMTQQGFQNAREALIAGAPQFQNAIMGTPVDYGAISGSQTPINYDASFFEGLGLPQGAGSGTGMPDIDYTPPQSQATQDWLNSLPNWSDVTDPQLNEYIQATTPMVDFIPPDNVIDDLLRDGQEDSPLARSGIGFQLWHQAGGGTGNPYTNPNISWEEQLGPYTNNGMDAQGNYHPADPRARGQQPWSPSTGFGGTARGVTSAFDVIRDYK